MPPQMIPPDTLTGEFTYVYPDPEEALLARLKRAKNIAVVTVVSDSHFDELWVAKIKIQYGWGFQKGRFVDYVRTADTCSKPEILEEGTTYVAILNGGEITDTVELALAKPYIETLGEPRYIYSNSGLTINEPSR